MPDVPVRHRPARWSDKRPEMKHQTSRNVFAYWDGLRGASSLPERCDFDPLAVREWLDWIVMIDTDIASGAPMRVAGSGVSALFGRELRGSSFVSLWRLRDRAETIDWIESACQAESPNCETLLVAPPDRDPVPLELLILPFRHQDGAVTRALCVLSIDPTPRWAGLMPLAPLAWTPARIIAPVRREPAPVLSRV